jgi:hypothetical protein
VAGENGREDDGVDERDGGDRANVGRCIFVGLGVAVSGETRSRDRYCNANRGDSFGLAVVRNAMRIVT